MWDENRRCPRTGAWASLHLCGMAKKRARKKDARTIDRAAKRAAQKAAGAFDGRFREKKVESARRYKRVPKHPPALDEE